MALADECDWLELLVASERTRDLLDKIQTASIARRVQSLQKLIQNVESREAYAEEARQAGALKTLTNLIASTDNEEILNLAAKAIAACSGPLSGGRKERKVNYGNHSVWIQEAALGDGLGARIWIAAHILSRKLVAAPDLVKGFDVLELGSGCGLCGILAAKLGAKSVTLTDYEPMILENLRDCCAGNASANEAWKAHAATEKSGVSTTGGDVWNYGIMKICKLDWTEALHTPPPPQSPSVSCSSHVERNGAPLVHQDSKFSRIIGSDLLYEVDHGVLVAAVIAERLESLGKAHITLAVRRKEHLNSLLQAAEHYSLKVSLEKETVDDESIGIVGREDEYEGGFVTVNLHH